MKHLLHFTLLIGAGAGACADPGGAASTTVDSSGGVPEATLDATGAPPIPDTWAGDDLGPSDAATTPGPSDTTAPDEIAPAVPGAPMILALSSNTRRITSGESVTFSAVVTDPDGIDDLIGGTLRDPVSGSTYGAFATAAAEGAYQLTLSWAQMNVTAPIDFDAETDRVFLADFFDQLGHLTTGEVRVVLHCDGDPACRGECAATSCDGGCMALDVMARDVDNCGGCGVVCQPGAECVDGDCACPDGWIECGGECVDPSSDANNCGGCGIECPEGACGDGYCHCETTRACPGDEACIPNGSWAVDWICHELGGVRLVGGGEHDGAAEIQMDLGFIGVCQGSTNAAAIICRELFGPEWTGTGSNSGSDDRNALDMQCTGDESELAQCAPILTGGCPGLLYVRCEERPPPPPSSSTLLDTTASVALGAYKRYSVQVVAGQRLTVTTTAPGDVDLYLRFGQAPTKDLYDLGAETESGNERISFSVTTEGTLHIAVYGYEASSFRIVLTDP